MLMTLRYFKSGLVKRNWYLIIAYNFTIKANLSSLFSGTGMKVLLALVGPLFNNSELRKSCSDCLKLTSYNLQITVCHYHVTYEFQSESTLYSCLNVKELLARNKRHI